MKFKGQFLQDVVYGESETGKTVKQEMQGQRRWVTEFSEIFSFEGKFYQMLYDQGSTESCEQAPFEFQLEDDIECPEVHEVEKTIKVWESIK